MSECVVVLGALRGLSWRVVNDRGDAELRCGDAAIDLFPYLGRGLGFTLQADVICVHCQRRSNKSFGGGFCWDCFKTLARCDLCVPAPTRCHFAQGTCREPEFGRSFCQQPHWVYLANSSGLKVGLTNAGGLPGRWLDQGAIQGCVVARATTREIAGHLEAALARFVADRTDPRGMLTRAPTKMDLPRAAAELYAQVLPALHAIRQRFGKGAVEWMPPSRPALWFADYPMLEGIRVDLENLRLEVGQRLTARLLGYKAQYLIFDRGVLSLSRYRSHEMRIEFDVEPGTVPTQASLF